MASCAAYAINRWLLKPHFHRGFFHSHFNDLLLIPCALPPLLWIHRRLGWRREDHFPMTGEIAFHLVVWSALFEVFGPLLVKHATGDPWDVATYTAGGIAAWAWWRWGSNPWTTPTLPHDPGPR